MRRRTKTQKYKGALFENLRAAGPNHVLSLAIPSSMLICISLPLSSLNTLLPYAVMAWSLGHSTARLNSYIALQVASIFREAQYVVLFGMFYSLNLKTPSDLQKHC